MSEVKSPTTAYYEIIGLDQEYALTEKLYDLFNKMEDEDNDTFTLINQALKKGKVKSIDDLGKIILVRLRRIRDKAESLSQIIQHDHERPDR